MTDKQELTIPGQYSQIRQLCEFVAAGASQAGLDEGAVFHVELCCDEAATNIIEHAYGAEDVGDITVDYEATVDTFTIRLHDNGRSFEPAFVPEPDLPVDDSTADDDAVQNLKIGGLGIHFMRNLMDEVYFNFDMDKGNTLVLIKKIPQGKPQ